MALIWQLVPVAVQAVMALYFALQILRADGC